jgi:predicted metal-dependent hydrolase
MRKTECDNPQPLEELVPIAVFKAEVAAWARRIGVEPKEVRLQPMKRKWASCSRKGRLTFDPALLRQPAPFRARAIVHELLHLKVPHHGKLFQALFQAFLSQEEGEQRSRGVMEQWSNGVME